MSSYIFQLNFEYLDVAEDTLKINLSYLIIFINSMSYTIIQIITTSHIIPKEGNAR